MHCQFRLGLSTLSFLIPGVICLAILFFGYGSIGAHYFHIMGNTCVLLF